MNESEVKYESRTVTALFANDKFGSGSLLSVNIDEKAVAMLTKVQLGGKFLVKKAAVKNAAGNDTYFLEVLAPYVAPAVAVATPKLGA